MDAPAGIDYPEPAYVGESDENIRAAANVTPDLERYEVEAQS
jgi:hypothetical protein